MNNVILTVNEHDFLLNYIVPMIRGREYVTNLAKKLPRTAKQKDELVEMLEVQTIVLKALKILIDKQQAEINLAPFYKNVEVVD